MIINKDNQKFELVKGHYLQTSEQATNAHPEQLCNYIENCIHQACLEQDSEANLQFSVAFKNNTFYVFGDVAMKSVVCYEQIVRKALKDVGYDNTSNIIDYKTANIIVQIDNKNTKPQVYTVNAYATNETPECLPLSEVLCNQLLKKLEQYRSNNTWLKPDIKVQITVEFLQDGTPCTIKTIVIGMSHEEKNEKIEKNEKNEKIDYEQQVIEQAKSISQLIDNKTQFYFPQQPVTLKGISTNRNNQKELEIAKALIKSNQCKRVNLSFSYAQGLQHATNIVVNTYGTGDESAILQSLSIKS